VDGGGAPGRETGAARGRRRAGSAVRAALRAALAGGLALGAASCAQNAFFELTLVLPPRGASDKTHAVVQFEQAAPFELQWAGASSLPGFPLGDDATVVPISVEGGSDDEARPLRVKLRFCRSANCSAIGDDTAPEVHVEFERVFYVGQRTSHTLRGTPASPDESATILPGLAMVPTSTGAVTRVDRCEIQGCRGGVSASGYCTLDGRHFCEAE
jgi:hypothetical protein